MSLTPNLPLQADDERLPAVRARLFLLARSLWKAGVLQVPLAPGPDEAPALRLLHPLWQRLRVELLGERLLRDVLPAIERQLSSEGRLLREAGGLNPQAPVDWPATWRHNLSRPAEAGLVTRRWERQLQLPENQLAHHALLGVAHDAELALQGALSAEEAAPLRRLRDGAHRRLARLPWSHFAETSAMGWQAEAEARIRRASPQRPAYGALLAWWQQWQGWQQPQRGDTTLLDPALEADWLFELLVLFELVTTLAQRCPVRQSRALGGDSRAPLFVAQTARGPLLLFYRSGTMFTEQRSLEEIRGIPDIVLQLPGKVPSYVILDAKNYGSSGHTQAIYKMLGYLYQFGYNAEGTHHFERVHAGILAFPTNEREGHALHNWQRPLPGAQAVMSFVLPPLPDERFIGLPALIVWLISQIEQ